MFKAIVGIMLGIAAVATTVGIVKATSKKYATTSGETVEDDSFLKKIKKAARKKVLEILQFVINHQEQIEAVTTVIGLAAGVIEIGSYAKSMKDHNEILTRLDKIENDVYDKGYADAWTDSLAEITGAANAKKPLVYKLNPDDNRVIKQFKVEEVLG